MLITYPKRGIAELRLVLRILKSMTSGLEVLAYEKKLQLGLITEETEERGMIKVHYIRKALEIRKFCSFAS